MGMISRFCIAVLVMLVSGCTTVVTSEDTDMYDRESGITVPLTAGGWARFGTLFTGNSTQSLSMQRNMGSPAGNYTVSFSLKPQAGGVASNHPIRCEATITFSTAGNDYTRRVVVGNGVSLTGVGDTVKVVVQDATSANPPGAPAPPNNAPYDVTIQVARGVRGTTGQPPTFTPNPPLVIVTAGNQVKVPIPQDVGVLSVGITVVNTHLGTAVPAGATRVGMVQGPLLETYRSYDPVDFDWIPVPPGTTILTLDNGLAPGVNTDIAFSIAFGVEG